MSTTRWRSLTLLIALSASACGGRGEPENIVVMGGDPIHVFSC